MPTFKSLTVLAVLLAGAACAVPAESADDKDARDKTESSTSDGIVNPAPEEEPAPEPNPDANYTSSCDYLLGDFTDYSANGYTFVADARIKNTGNIGIKYEARAAWFQAGGGKVHREKTGKLQPGKVVRVGFNVPVSSNEIDRIQALDGGQNCKIVVAMVDTFGQPQ